jgi:hypothetical protein
MNIIINNDDNNNNTKRAPNRSTPDCIAAVVDGGSTHV